jgi:hypothetical protein
LANRDKAESSKDKDPLEVHDLVDKLVKEPGLPANALRLVGYVGKSGSTDVIRLFLNLNFDEFVDIPRNKILHAVKAPENVIEFGGTYLWISRDTNIIHTRIESTKEQARFIEGAITKNYLQPSGSSALRGNFPSVNSPCPTPSAVHQCGNTIDWFCGHGPTKYPCTELCPTIRFQCTQGWFCGHGPTKYPCTELCHTLLAPCEF